MNSRLSESSSPYLRAHADNPVEWFPWGPEAFAEAARRGVPVLVSIGYSTCHWCHVMARESFQDDATAALINDGFVAVKVDREEHPDVDAAYLDAASAFTPHLGWPLTVFTTPEGRVFYAGTYWPGEPRPPLPAFREVLGAVREAWTDRREEVERTGAALRDALAEAARASSSSSGTPNLDQLAEAARGLTAREDPDYGGFAAGSGLETPKFPTVPALRFLQSPALADASAAAVARRAVDAMASSELHDPVDGGFFRYATRRDWSVPHYERMLTDNAGLVEVALDAGRPDVAADAARFLIDVLQQPSGGFAAAQDSESIIDGERDEGGYYARDADGRAKLAPPSLDGKIVTAWNGLAIAALARAGARLGARAADGERLVEAARWAADAVLESNVGDDGMLRRASLDEIVSRSPATLEDYGSLARGLATLAATTGEVRYAEAARDLIDACLTGDGISVPGGGDPVLVGQGMAVGGSDTDGASPSPTAAFAGGALALWHLGAGERYREAAVSLVSRVAQKALEQPLGHGAILEVAVSLASSPRQVVVVADPGSPMIAAARSIRADVVAVVTDAQAEAFTAAGFTLFESKTARHGLATAYDCRAFVCRLPVTDPADLGI
ncbi:thioredoxin domain-containing protein [Microbacterium sp. P06]|uniref:thioredoxin domain-containing protein n=1 Tax=Microbacterium sp. P06 TaxID=3366949 RepID=UPI003746E94B